MNTIEQDLMARFAELDLATKQRLLAQVEIEKGQSVDIDDWLMRVAQFREKLHPATPFMSAVDVIREIRNEDDDHARGG